MTEQVVKRFLSVARAKDITAMYSLIDWPLSGGSRMLRALHNVDKPMREELVRRGLEELAGTEDSEAALTYRLARLALRLEGVVRVRLADSTERYKAIVSVRLNSIPEGLSEETLAALQNLKERAARVSEVFVIETERDELLVIALSPDLDRIVLVR